MFGFAIALRSKGTTNDWDRIVSLLGATINSVLNQESPDFKVVVGCHEVPESLAGIDPRIAFESVASPVPIYHDEFVADKQRKREAATLALFQQGCRYIMPLDADDLVSKRLVGFVLQNPVEFGYVANRGYEYSLVRDAFSLCPALSRICGSCAVFHWREEDLPTVAWERGQFAYRDQVNTVHPDWIARGKRVGRPLTPLPFRAVTYVLETEQNISMRKGNLGWKRPLIRKFMPTIRNDAALRTEFGLAEATRKVPSAKTLTLSCGCA